MFYLYISGVVFFTVIGQLVGKYRMSEVKSNIPDLFFDKVIHYVTKLIFDPFIIISLACGFIASFFWLMTISKYDLSYSYSFLSITYPLLFVSSVLLFNEDFTIYKIVGNTLIILGIIIMNKV